MAEPTSAIPALVIGGTAAVSAFPGVDPMSVMAAGAGAGIFVLSAPWIKNPFVKVCYFVLSWVFGYIFAVAGPNYGWLAELGSPMKAFCAALLVVMVCVSVIEFMRTGAFPEWMKKLFALRLKSRGDSDA